MPSRYPKLVFPQCIAVALAFALGPCSAAAAPSQQNAGERHLTFTTKLTPATGLGTGHLDGSLTLTIGADGIVNGTYRDWDEGIPRTIKGGSHDQEIWFDIAGLQRRGLVGRVNSMQASTGPRTIRGLGQQMLHVAGTFKDGKIVGSTQVGDETYTFQATPAKP